MARLLASPSAISTVLGRQTPPLRKNTPGTRQCPGSPSDLSSRPPPFSVPTVVVNHQSTGGEPESTTTGRKAVEAGRKSARAPEGVRMAELPQHANVNGRSSSAPGVVNSTNHAHSPTVSASQFLTNALPVPFLRSTYLRN